MYRRLLALYAVLMVILCLPHSAFSQEMSGQGKHRKFSRQETTWALQWINHGLTVFMEKGFVKKIVTKDDAFEVYAGRQWYRLSFDQQGEFLKNLSRAREITGHSPFFTVFDDTAAATVARVSGSAIEILSPDEGFKQYRPEPGEEKNTAY